MGHKIDAALIKTLLGQIGENPEREGLIDTPGRVAKMYTELFAGYNTPAPVVTKFPNGKDGITYNSIITDTGEFFSTCEHHMLPFVGRYYFGYIPGEHGNVLGLSKVARIVDWYAARLQIQERLVTQVVDHLWRELATNGKGKPNEEPQGMALVMKAEHMCKTIRGVKKHGEMVTSEMRGIFYDDQNARMEFLHFVNGNKGF